MREDGDPDTDCLQLLALVRSLRDAGLFTTVAIATPFEFEGAKRVQTAALLVAQLHAEAHLVTVVDQVPSPLALALFPRANACQ